jgi:hypothetical protein
LSFYSFNKKIQIVEWMAKKKKGGKKKKGSKKGEEYLPPIYNIP